MSWKTSGEESNLPEKQMKNNYTHLLFITTYRNEIKHSEFKIDIHGSVCVRENELKI